MRKKYINKKIFVLLSLIFTFFLISTLGVFILNDKRSLDIVDLLIAPTQEKISQFKSNYPEQESFGVNLKITPINLTKKIDYESINNKEYNLIEGFSYKLEGHEGFLQKDFYQLDFTLLGISFTRNFHLNILNKPSKNENVFEGEKPIVIALSELRTLYNKFISDLSLKDINNLTKYFKNSELVDGDNSKLFENVEFGDIVLKDPAPLNVLNGMVEVGYLKINLNNCNREVTLSIYYDIDQKFWKLYSLPQFIELLCPPQFEKSGEFFIGKCVDCSLYPVNKRYGLRPDYVPNIIEFPLQLGVVIDQRILDDLTSMYRDAQNSGHAIIINSSYRSYSVQQDTFENWVQFEMAQGRDRITAENIANSYSARAGFSEHQLGTTLDIATTQCPNFGKGCGPNENLWLWLRNNAYRYGFALSYPEDKETITGYIYEPWHYRWIGIELATEFKSIESTITLQEFLFSKNMF